uniref:Uncharacterized protein n=1 Tax=Anguilla anguilla TaxID=7936 RepID=A0A0E9Q8H4_ANGAN
MVEGGKINLRSQLDEDIERASKERDRYAKVEKAQKTIQKWKRTKRGEK